MAKHRLQDAFGTAPAAFDAFVDTALDRARSPKAAEPQRLSLRTAVLVVAAVLLITGTALALSGGMGVLDFQATSGATPLPSATQMVVDLSSVPGVDASRVHYQVRDAVMDRDRFLMTVAVTPKQPDAYCLLDSGEDLFAARMDGRAVLQVSAPTVWVDGDGGIQQSGAFAREGESIVYYRELTGLAPLDEVTVEVACEGMYREVTFAGQWMDDDGFVDTRVQHSPARRSTLRFPMQVSQAQAETARADGPFAVGRSEIEWIQVRCTPLATTLRVRYRALGEATAEETTALALMVFEWALDPGEMVVFPAQLDTVQTREVADGVWEQEALWPARVGVPKVVAIREAPEEEALVVELR